MRDSFSFSFKISSNTHMVVIRINRTLMKRKLLHKFWSFIYLFRAGYDTPVVASAAEITHDGEMEPAEKGATLRASDNAYSEPIHISLHANVMNLYRYIL